MNNETNIEIKFDTKVTQGKSLENLAKNLERIKNALGGVDSNQITAISNTNGNFKEIKKNTSEAKDSTGKMFNVSNINRFNSALTSTVRLLSKLSKFMTASSDYLENLNLFQVAFEGNYNSATKFVNTMSEMYGLDESWGYKTVGIFKQLTNAMNLSTETGEKFSQLLTQMSLDISSLYNVDINRASSVLQSSLAG